MDVCKLGTGARSHRWSMEYEKGEETLVDARKVVRYLTSTRRQWVNVKYSTCSTVVQYRAGAGLPWAGGTGWTDPDPALL